MVDPKDGPADNGPGKPKEPESKQAKGGRARARKLSKSERSEIARKGGAARAGWPQATHAGPLVIGGIELDCAVLDDGSAVISETKLMEHLGMYRSGALSTRRVADDSGVVVPLHLAYKNLEPFVRMHFGAKPYEQLKYRTKQGSLAHAIRAEDLPKLCEVWLDARNAGVLGPRQQQIAEVADILIRGFAHVGVVALVHEATGFQYDRQREYLQELLKDILSDNLRRWVKTFPSRYFKELCRLRGVPYRADMRLPMYFGTLTNDIVYKRLAPGVLKELQDRNPRLEGGRKNKHHQWLSEDVGHPKLLQHLGLAVGLMTVSEDYDAFSRLLNKAAPHWVEPLPLFAESPNEDGD
ncbi:MAG TPA: P63C domain-containing protein [Candidatus Acidoferrales bacterium]|nr:P63C domain-containing protein [Candidatus Acidoferrales bacterium]